MGCPDQGNKAQTPVGYSHGTGVSTGGPATAVLGVVAWDTPGVHRFVWGHALRRPLYALHGVAGSSLQTSGAAKFAKGIATA